MNTKAKNIIVFDNRINQTRIDLFTFNNIRGRSGRMMQHFVGRVFVFHEPPGGGLPEVDIPVVTQPEDAAASLLIQLDDRDLSDGSRSRLQRFSEQQLVGYDTLKANIGINLDQQLALAQEITDNWRTLRASLQWTGLPTYEELGVACRLIWELFGGSSLGSGSIRSHKQLTLFIWKLIDRPTAKDVIDAMVGGKTGNADAEVTRALDFLRLWANFHFPRLLRALDRIQRDISGRMTPSGRPGNYEFFAASVENLFLDPSLVALEEYGLPLEIARKITDNLRPDGDLDGVLGRLGAMTPNALPLSAFERTLVEITQTDL